MPIIRNLHHTFLPPIASQKLRVSIERKWVELSLCVPRAPKFYEIDPRSQKLEQWFPTAAPRTTSAPQAFIKCFLKKSRVKILLIFFKMRKLAFNFSSWCFKNYKRLGNTERGEAGSQIFSKIWRYVIYQWSLIEDVFFFLGYQV